MVCIPCFTVVATSEIVAVERCGKWSRFAEAGCVCYMWPWENFAKGGSNHGFKESFRQEVVDVSLRTKTIDNVFVDVVVACNYQVDKVKVYSAFYKLENRKQTMTAYIKDGIRTSICSMTLDALYAGKEEVSEDLKLQLVDVFIKYGLNILNVLIREITPDSKVLAAMNQINASKREREAAMQRAEGEKVIKVKRAEADAEAMYLSGEGVARQRKAIMDGLKNSIVDFSSKVADTSPKDVMDLLILNQYFDALESIGAQGNMRTIMLPADSTAGRSSVMEGMEGIMRAPK
jgi:regulator of protease activity HflC (stomatin/prohibitin superfamily)